MNLKENVQKLNIGNCISILALDHGLTSGPLDSIQPSKILPLTQVLENKIGGVVLNFGLAKFCRENNLKIPLILQCFGSPSGMEKAQVASINEAIYLDSTAISVQIRFEGTKLPSSSLLKSISKLTGEAYHYKLPVLFMVTLSEDTDLASAANAIRICQELGADLIKIRIDLSRNHSHQQLQRLALIVSQSPPVLFAGGAVSTNFLPDTKIAAKRLGFSGYCVGRNIYQSKDPLSVILNLNQVWDECPISLEDKVYE